jgi:ketosteroid isomerase-like protein
MTEHTAGAMTTTAQTGRQTALDTAIAYYHAWAGGDFERAMDYIDPGIVCDAPAGPVRGAEAFRAFMGPFAAMAQSSRLLAAYGDHEHAVLVYDTATPLVSSAPGAELHTVAGGRIVAMRLVFDRLPFEQARRGGS